jgi:hypothetical protein
MASIVFDKDNPASRQNAQRSHDVRKRTEEEGERET